MRPILQIIISLIVIGLVLIQERAGGMSGIFGGGGGTPYYARRGVEKGIFYATIVAVALFALLALLNLFLA
ncbi:MAG: preprotein translocase subunit SecG [Candidatus Brennerbacteria bacterium]|nr:preprotein translocase subunit SecG [Candidatus Brennerbacteria bacterium]